MGNWESISSDVFKSLGVGLQSVSNLTQPTAGQTQTPQNRQIASKEVKITSQPNESGGGGTFKSKGNREAFSFYKANLVGSVAQFDFSRYN